MSNMEEIQKKQAARCGCRAKPDATADSHLSTGASGDALPCGEITCDPLETVQARRVALEAALDELEAAAVAYADSVQWVARTAPRHIFDRLLLASETLTKLRKGAE